jgi:diacylglycerol kinase (ATP)
VSREIALLINPTSGKGRGARFATPVATRLREAGLTVRELVGRDADEALELGRAAVADGADGLVVVGGDGMVHLGLQVVAGTAIPLGIVAAGTGNDIARALELPLKDAAAAANVVIAGYTRPMDAARTGGRWFGSVLASGFDSRVNDRANRMTWPSGRSRYNLAILAELRVFQPLRYTIELDGERLETDAMLVAVGNGPSYGGGMRVCPAARLDDGLLDVTVVGPLSKPEFVRIFPSVYRGTHVRHPQVTTHQARVVSLAADGVTAYADGERVASLPVTTEAVPAALQVFCPSAR